MNCILFMVSNKLPRNTNRYEGKAMTVLKKETAKWSFNNN